MELITTFGLLLCSCGPTIGLALRAAPSVVVDQAWQHEVRSAFFGIGSRAPAASSEEKQDGRSNQKQPVVMQVTDEELGLFSDSLSAECKAQFKAMLKGEGSGIHTFQDPGLLQQRNASKEGNASEAATHDANASREHNASSAVNASASSNASSTSNASNASNVSSAPSPYANMSDSEATCTKLDGGLCFTRALVKQTAEQGGRSMRSQVDVDGNGCLPKQCMAQSDLQAWADFMRGKAKENLPGADISIELFVNCSEAGGGVVKSGPEPPAA